MLYPFGRKCGENWLYSSHDYRKRERMRVFRRIMTMVLCAGIIFGLALSAKASQTGSIQIKTTGGTVALYKVGQINGQSIHLYEEYGGGIVGEMDILSDNLAGWLNERAQNGHIKDTDIWGDTLFENLSPGLYLVTQPSTPSGQQPFEPFLIIMPWDGDMWEITVDLEMLPQTGSSIVPDIWILAMLLSALGVGTCIWYRKKIVV